MMEAEKPKDWRNLRFYPDTAPCVVCGSTFETGSEPRFGYVVCEAHSNIAPVDINQYLPRT